MTAAHEDHCSPTRFLLDVLTPHWDTLSIVNRIPLPLDLANHVVDECYNLLAYLTTTPEFYPLLSHLEYAVKALP